MSMDGCDSSSLNRTVIKGIFIHIYDFITSVHHHTYFSIVLSVEYMICFSLNNISVGLISKEIDFNIHFPQYIYIKHPVHHAVEGDHQLILT